MKTRTIKQILEILEKYGLDDEGNFTVNGINFQYEPLFIRKGGYIKYEPDETPGEYFIKYRYGWRRGCYINITVIPEYNKFTVDARTRKYARMPKDEKEEFNKTKDWLIGLMTSICLDMTS